MNIKRIIREEINNELQWIKDVKPTLNDAFEQGTLKVGDVLTLSGDLADCDAKTTKEVNDFKIKIVKLKGNINNSHFIPLQKKYWEHLEYEGKGNTRFYGSDGKMKIEDHHNELMESNELEWIQGGPDFNLQTSEFYIDLDGVSNEETCEIQQKILDVGVYWSGKGKKLKKEHCNNSKAYIIKKGKLYISTYNYNKYNTMVKQLKDTTENFPRLYGKNFSQLFK
ncbi:hypothetical protein N9966_00645 [bacterium]|nr:hypothetical protein [bacterium]